ncbi:LysR family transcriptional regulator [Paracraurococcus ruber]|uniref:LysR family transcriptional regulator n=1 Tax=Paracraurococcus ruber TaxID=77675 RepID=A0ABS1D6F5_9PROT|nr:LysR family transcriptional regulator [Paracraurococcus ruber]MBK1662050.1 LysR family transcriptional regulator [Paracraurococcus ruber]TDG27218.1 LysR family transcriptional regulator [Paracraurococcus ruber]
MDIDDLRAFVEVADAGGVTPAARRLGISKSMVSRRLVGLERELGVQLLARTTRGASITEAGATFRDHAARAIAEIDIARETILPAGDLRGRLRVAAPLSFGPTHFAHVLADMARRHPELHIHASYTDRHVDLIAEGFDCAIRVGKLNDSNLIARKIGPLHAKYVAAPAYIAEHGAPETPDELTTHEALMQATEPWFALDGDQVIRMRPQGRFKADNGAALIAAVLAGIGIAVLPVNLIREHLEAGTLVEVMPRYPVPVHGIYVVRPPGQHPVRKIRVLTEMLIECFGEAEEGTGSSRDASARSGLA